MRLFSALAVLIAVVTATGTAGGGSRPAHNVGMVQPATPTSIGCCDGDAVTSTS